MKAAVLCCIKDCKKFLRWIDTPCGGISHGYCEKHFKEAMQMVPGLLSGRKATMPETRAEQAQRLVDEGRVNIVMQWYHATEAEVQGDDELYCTILYDNGLYSCDCGWTQYHASPTDLCVHALAVKLAVLEESPKGEKES